MKLLLVVLFVSILSYGSVYGEADNFTIATAEWGQASYSSNKGTHATITVDEPDMNRHPNVIDYIWVTIHSDSDPDLAGTKMTLFETDFDTGVFQRDVIFSDSPPSGNGFLHVTNGDTIYIKYIDTTIPANYTLTDSRQKQTKNGIEVHASALTGQWGPPMIRAPASDLRIMDINKESTIDIPLSVDKQIMFVSDLQSNMDKILPFVYIVQIQNEQGKVESLSWLTGNLTASQKIMPGVTWIPFSEGLYTATVFVWEAINNPTAYSPPVTLEFEVQ